MAKHRRTLLGTTPCFILIALTMFVAVSHRTNAECDPLGLVTHDDYLVDVGFRHWGPTVGIDECGRFIVAYWANVVGPDFEWTADLILAKRFLPDASPWANDPFFITEFDDRFATSMQGHAYPSVAVSRSGNVHVAWISRCDQCNWPPCDGDPFCEYYPNNAMLML